MFASDSRLRKVLREKHQHLDMTRMQYFHITYKSLRNEKKMAVP